MSTRRTRRTPFVTGCPHPPRHVLERRDLFAGQNAWKTCLVEDRRWIARARRTGSVLHMRGWHEHDVWRDRRDRFGCSLQGRCKFEHCLEVSYTFYVSAVHSTTNRYEIMKTALLQNAVIVPISLSYFGLYWCPVTSTVKLQKTGSVFQQNAANVTF